MFLWKVHVEFFYLFFQNNSNVQEESEAFVWRCQETNDNLFIRKKQDWENSAHILLFMTLFQAVLIYTILWVFFVSFFYFFSYAENEREVFALRFCITRFVRKMETCRSIHTIIKTK